jgi:hypothetical protein
MLLRRDGEIDSIKDEMPAGANLDARQSDRRTLILAMCDRLLFANPHVDIVDLRAGVTGGSSRRRRGAGC